jgi:hypothetical protein
MVQCTVYAMVEGGRLTTGLIKRDKKLASASEESEMEKKFSQDTVVKSDSKLQSAACRKGECYFLYT